MPTLDAQFLVRSIHRVFVAAGASDASAQIVADHLVDAEMAGVSSHGIIRLPQYLDAVREGRVKPDACATCVRQTAATAVLDGNRGFGQVAAFQAAQVATLKATTAGAGVVTLTNCGHTGRLGYYTEWAAKSGFVAIMMVNAGGCGQWVAPFGGLAGRLSTNPISIACPSAAQFSPGGFPMVIDIATSIVPEGKIRSHLAKEKPIPEGWVMRHDGSSTKNPADLYGPPRGAILPFGGHKGFGLSVLIDALAGCLSGAGCCTSEDMPASGSDGILFIAIRPDAFLPAEQFLNQVRDLIEHVKTSPPVPGVEEVIVPGEREHRLRQSRRRDGAPIDDEIWRVVKEILRS